MVRERESWVKIFLSGVNITQIKWVGFIQSGGRRGRIINKFRSQNMCIGRGRDEVEIDGSNEEKMSVSIKT